MNEKHITIDRHNSVEFSFHASSKNTELKELYSLSGMTLVMMNSLM